MAKNKEDAKKKATAGKLTVETGISSKGRKFQGIVTKKFAKRIVVELERTIYVPKYERYYKKKIRLHARIPEGSIVDIGDHVKIRECRPLSKIIHFVLIEIIKTKGATA
jgi:small subunit ribosomal protein S17